ncbi:shikimate dehydrogenase [Frisingicoccus caecimuris]|uniref:Shikimate dehydrogenase (NADP(+)) n=1 Tax=Frisingicoccus caecimuris TaxID=1796636 RepID=A0A4V2SDU3_9FIRM|nr:shikimate dehydrogenase [Frisingicoccus caecimuris]MCR1918529.1 shikimate dehydrogenase [Frisingicoccus caecimuris]TCO85178.1 shikimate dehydrogenase [Frisingicoccus caecimuris]
MAEKCYRSELIGLFGCPVDENPTVVIMEAAFKALGLNYRYNTMLVYPENLETAVKSLKALHMKGTHITIPHKVSVIPYLDRLTDTAALIGAVNTVYEDHGEMVGENTDGKGFIKSLEDEHIKISGKKAVILGAGGAARAIAVELALAGTRKIIIVNRSPDRGETLVKLINEKTTAHAEFTLWEGCYNVDEDTDILVNCTSIGLYPDTNVPNIDYNTLKFTTVVCDIIPNPLHTRFMAKAQACGCKTLDGFSMLINQAAVSFKLWTGIDAPVEIMKMAMMKENGDL